MSLERYTAEKGRIERGEGLVPGPPFVVDWRQQSEKRGAMC